MKRRLSRGEWNRRYLTRAERRKVHWHTDAPAAYRAIYLERFGAASLCWVRREKDEQEPR